MEGVTHFHEAFINASEGYMFGEHTDPIEGTVFEDMDTPGELYRWLQREYGRCTGKVYIDSATGPKHVGWTFVNRDKYEDTGEKYLREVWVTFLTRYEKRTEKEYANLGDRP